MTPKETVQLTRYVKACCPQQQIDDYTPDAWYDLLGHLGLEECREAAASVARRKPFVAPSEIIREIADCRAAYEPHSAACRGVDHGDCRVSWCGCPCHPAVIRAVVPGRWTVRRAGEPRQVTPGEMLRDG